MNLIATIEIYAFGTSEGVRKEWDTRGRARTTWEGPVRSTGVLDPHAPFMRLELNSNPGNAPILFSNDNTLYWHKDENDNLVVEIEEEKIDNNANRLGYGQKTVYTIPHANIRYWGVEERRANEMRIPHPPIAAPSAHV